MGASWSTVLDHDCFTGESLWEEGLSPAGLWSLNKAGNQTGKRHGLRDKVSLVTVSGRRVELQNRIEGQHANFQVKSMSGYKLQEVTHFLVQGRRTAVCLVSAVPAVPLPVAEEADGNAAALLIALVSAALHPLGTAQLI